MNYTYKLLTSRPLLECQDEFELDEHTDEIIDLLYDLRLAPDYDCALVCQYQDILHSELPKRVESCYLRNLQWVPDMLDMHGGMDWVLDEDHYLCILLYGDVYQYMGETHVTTLAVKVLPYNERRQFMDISKVLLGTGAARVAKVQYDLDLDTLN